MPIRIGEKAVRFKAAHLDAWKLRYVKRAK
jgi:predicted DNA-binding transcriptional regulator AlpA